MSTHPWDTASCPTRFFLLWVWPFLWRGAKTPVQQDDVHELPDCLQSFRIDELCRRYLSLGDSRQSGGSPYKSLRRVLFRAFGWRYVPILAAFSVWFAPVALIPFLSETLFNFLESDDSTYIGLAIATCLALNSLANCNGGCQWYQQTAILGCQMRNSVSMLVFRRALRLPSWCPWKDRALNLVQVDAERVFLLVQLNHMVPVATIVSVLSFGLLVGKVGVLLSVLVFAVIFVVVFVQSQFMRVASRARKRMQRLSDNRVGQMAEVLESIRVLKMYGWTTEVTKQLGRIRTRELAELRSYLLMRAASSALLYCAPLLQMLLVVFFFEIRGIQPSVYEVFLVFTIVGIARAPIGGLAIGMTAIVEGNAALGRLQEFIIDSETDTDCPAALAEDGVEGRAIPPSGEALSNTKTAPQVAADAAVDSQGSGEPLAYLTGNFTVGGVSKDSLVAPFRLSANEFTIRSGEVVAVTGSVGGGKSSLLLALLGEIPHQTGTVEQQTARFLACRRVAYLAQTPCIQRGTVREAIVQDLPEDSALYWRAVCASQLKTDLGLWDDGDATMVGSRGTTLSGGQRARLALAHVLYRCLVSPVDLVLLDDCFAAVDSHVASAIAREALLDVLVDGRRSIVMVLNSNFVALREASRVAHVDEGNITLYESVDEWLAAPCCSSMRASASTSVKLFKSPNTEVTDFHEQISPPSGEVGAKQRDEVAPEGRVHLSTCAFYFGAGHVGTGMVIFAAIAILMIGCETFRVSADYFMGQWSELQCDFNTYLICTAIACFCAYGRALAFMLMSLRTCDRIHKDMLERLLRAPMAFFDETPAGRIIGFFAKDMDALDALLPQFGLDFAQDISMMIGVLAVAIWSAPMSTLALIPVVCLFIHIRMFFSKTSRQLKRLDGVSRGPLFSAVAEAVDGLATFRAHRQTQYLIDGFAKLVNCNGKVFFQLSILQPWCILVLDSIGAFIVFITSVSCVFLRGSMSHSAASMAISYALSLRGKLQWSVRLSIEAENQMIAVERLKRFAEALPQESTVGFATVEPQVRALHVASDEDAGASVSAPWPAEGAISFRDVRMRYRPDLPLVLRGVSLDIPAGSKVGLVGRTGGGKSSVLAAILRLVEPETGSIVIDGVDVGTLTLEKLRSSVSIIPQDPQLWTGTVAQNIDPSEALPMEVISRAVDSVGLTSVVGEMGGLCAAVEARGCNFSNGQKQLLCIARCVARRSRVVLIDEATSSVDIGTDKLIQDVFRAEFDSCTSIVIAHRLQTILDASMIVVLDAGSIVEVGPPSTLCNAADSRFSALASELRLSACNEDAKATCEDMSSKKREVVGEVSL